MTDDIGLITVDYNKELEVGDIDNGVVNVVVEIPIGSLSKIEWNSEKLVMELDRTEPVDFPEPANYGFIPRTLNEDGDALDVLVMTDRPIETGIVLLVDVIGVLEFIDEGQSDDKIIVVPSQLQDGDVKIGKLSDLSLRKINSIEYYFKHYKDSLDKSSTVVKGWGDSSVAKKIIKDSVERWNNK